MRGREVRDPDVADEAGGEERLHGVPGGQVGNGVVGDGGDGPVHEVEVQIGCLEIGKGLLESREYGFGCVGVVPELRGQPDVVSMESSAVETRCQARADFRLVAVDMSTVDVAVAGLKGGGDDGGCIAGGNVPGTKA